MKRPTQAKNNFPWLTPQEEEAVDLAARAVAAGVFNDLGSGSNVDICVMKKGARMFSSTIITHQ